MENKSVEIGFGQLKVKASINFLFALHDLSELLRDAPDRHGP
jgi:hypothetical protein